MRKNRWFDSASTFALSRIVQCSIDGEIPDTGALTIDQAASLIGGGGAQPEAVEPEEKDEPNSDAGDSPADDAAGVDGEEPQPTDGDDDQASEVGEQESQPIEAPRSWNAEQRAKFAELPRELQEYWSQRETERESALNKAQTEAAETRKKAETELSQFGQYKARLDALLPQAEEIFTDRWKNVDWVKLTEQIGADEATKLKFQYDKEQGDLQKIRNEKTAADAVERTNYVKAEFEKLKTEAPELLDPKEGTNRRTAVGKFLADTGIPADAIRNISAAAMAIAYDAMRYREGKAALKQPKPAAKPGKPPVKPSGAKPGTASTKPSVAQLRSTYMKTGKVDDYVAYLNAKGD